MKWAIVLMAFFSPVISYGQDTLNVTTVLSKTEQEKQDSLISQQIIGKWKDQNSTLYFYPGRKHLVVYDDSTKVRGRWEIKKNKIVMMDRDYYHVITYKLLSFSPANMTFKLDGKHGDRTIWVAKKTGKFSN